MQNFRFEGSEHQRAGSAAAKEQELRNHLGSFGIKGGLATQKMVALSGGQAVRVGLATAALSCPQLLVLVSCGMCSFTCDMVWTMYAVSTCTPLAVWSTLWMGCTLFITTKAPGLPCNHLQSGTWLHMCLGGII